MNEELVMKRCFILGVVCFFVTCWIPVGGQFIYYKVDAFYDSAVGLIASTILMTVFFFALGVVNMIVSSELWDRVKEREKGKKE